jgi:hypothetical protein
MPNPTEIIPQDYKHDWNEGDRVLVCFEEPIQYIPKAGELQDTMKTKMAPTDVTFSRQWKIGTVIIQSPTKLFYYVDLDVQYRSFRYRHITYKKGWVHKSRIQPYIPEVF